MTRFIVNIWHQFRSEKEFERNIPLLINARRMERLGMANQIELVFLNGFELLSEEYKSILKQNGYTIHNAQAIVKEIAPDISVFAENWKNWGGIKHFGLARFLVMERLFSGEDIITFDGDMIMNCSFHEIEQSLSGMLYFLGGSSCFGSIPHQSDFFRVFREHVAMLNRNSEDYAQKIMGLSSAAEFFDPHKAYGTDQGFILHLLRQNIVKMGPGAAALKDHGLIGFPNVLNLRPEDQPFKYSRLDGVDYLNGDKVLIWHMSHDVCAYLGQYVFLRDWLGDSGARLFGKFGARYDHYEHEKTDPELRRFFELLGAISDRYELVNTVDRHPFTRSRVCGTFFEETDFSSIFNDESWHTEGIFCSEQ